MNELRTALCDLLGIRYPILQSGMGGVAGPELVAAVSRAGGLGILAGLRLSKDQLRQGVRRVRELTDRPFGVNLWLHTAIRPPADPATLPEETVRRVQGTLDTFRGQLGIPSRTERPAPVPDVIDEAFEVILEERVPVWSIGLGNPRRDMVARCHERGIKIIAMVATVDDARAVVASGVDAVVAQGSEAGGHRSTWVKPASRDAAQVGALALIPQIVDAVNVPVIAAGGIADGRGIAAAFALGAAGVQIGSAYLRCPESKVIAPARVALAQARDDSTVITNVMTGRPARGVANRVMREVGPISPDAPAYPHSATALGPLKVAAEKQGKVDFTNLWAGQAVRLGREMPAAELTRALAGAALARLSQMAG